ncbi:MAG: hypothetical protein FVQ77_03035 [Cytophagales bacterium]|nr:hypothetical protein [Cytophagales bacterium]
MKTTNLLLVLSAFLTLGALGTLTVNAQDMANGTPQAVRYQALAKDQQGNPVSNQLISLRISIFSGTINGTLEWEETHFPATDVNGLFEALIGAGVRTGGAKATFSEVEWASKKHFLKVEMDITGGTNFGDMGTTQFCSVPFAFSASEARKAVMADTARVAIKADTAKVALQAVCGCTLDDAYDNGTPGLPRIITADDGSVKIEVLPGAHWGLLIKAFGPVTGAARFTSDTNSANPTVSVAHEGAGVQSSAIGASTINQNNIAPVIIAQSFSGFNTFTGPTGQGNNSILGLNMGFSNYQPSIVGLTVGRGSAGYFRSLINQDNTQAVLRVESDLPLTPIGTFDALDNSHSVDVLRASTIGTGRAGMFQIDNTGNGSNALQAHTNGSGNAIRGVSLAAGTGGAGSFQVNNTANTSNALEVTNSGTGITGMFNSINNTGVNDPTLFSLNQGIGFGSVAGLFANLNTNNNAFTALYAATTGIGRTAFFYNFNAANDSNVVEATAEGTGTIMRAYSNTLGPQKHAGHFSGTHTTAPATQAESVVFSESDGFGLSYHGINSGSSAGVASFNVENTASTGTALITTTNGSGNGILSFANDGDAVQALSGSGSSGNALYAFKDPTDPAGKAALFDGDVEVIGVFDVVGTKNAIVKNHLGEVKTTYVSESTEVWFEDLGFGTLVNGEATINIEEEFLSLINTNEPYHVEIQLEGFCKDGVFITDKTLTSFKVVQNTPGQGQGQGQLCNAPFSYHITAKREGFETLRLATREQTRIVTQQHLQTVFPEKIAAAQQKVNDALSETSNLVSPGYTIDKPAPPPSVQTIVPNPWINGSIDVVAPVDTVSITIPDIPGGP